jgi:protein TonB
MKDSRDSAASPGNALNTPDLSRFCLEPDAAESRRALAWVNSICLVYLLIGVIGLKPPAPAINRHPSASEEAVPTIIEPLIPATPVISPDLNPEEAPSERSSDDAGGVAVTLDSPAVAFAVPTVGNMLVPLNKAAPPPAKPMQAVVSMSAPRIEQIMATGVGGNRPPPPYPADSLRRREEGTVLLLIEVDDSGRIADVTVKESSGYPRLDQLTADYVRRHWLFSAGKGTRLYESPIVFQLK